jgi:hypothetical protein
LLFLNGDAAHAARRERQAWLRENQRGYRDRISYFLDEHYQEAGILLTGTAQNGDVVLEHVVKADGSVVLIAHRTRDTGVFNFMVLAHRNGLREGIHSCYFGNATELTVFAGKDEFGADAEDLRYTLVMLDSENIRPGYLDRCDKANVSSENAIR